MPIRSLGKLQKRDKAAAWSTNGEVTYELSFEHGEARLTLRVENGLIEYAEFTGDDYLAAVKSSYLERYAAFGAYRVNLLLDDGSPNPRGNTFSAGQDIHFQFLVGGSALNTGKGAYELGTRVLDDTGKTLHKWSENIRVSVDIQGDLPEIPRVKGYVSALSPGAYTIVWDLKDKSNGATTRFEQKLVVK